MALLNFIGGEVLSSQVRSPNGLHVTLGVLTTCRHRAEQFARLMWFEHHHLGGRVYF